MSVREIHSKKNNRLTGKEICKVTWLFSKSVLIREKTAIRANLVVLAIDVVLAIGGVPTKLARMKMKPAIHKFVANFDIAIEVANVTGRRSASVGICHLVRFRHFPPLPGDKP